jgi:hypothetical protein
MAVREKIRSRRRLSVIGVFAVTVSGFLSAGAAAQASVNADESPGGSVRVGQYHGGSYKEVKFGAAPGVTNNIRVQVVSETSGDGQLSRYELTDSHPITPGEGCYYPDSAAPETVRCSADNVLSISLILGDAKTTDGRDESQSAVNDTETTSWIDSASNFSHLVGGSDWDQMRGNGILEGRGGADNLIARAGGVVMFGGDGNDVFYGGDGNDYLFGQGGNDYLAGAKGADYLDGGPQDSDTPGDTCKGGGQADDIVENCNP